MPKMASGAPPSVEECLRLCGFVPGPKMPIAGADPAAGAPPPVPKMALAGADPAAAAPPPGPKMPAAGADPAAGANAAVAAAAAAASATMPCFGCERTRLLQHFHDRQRLCIPCRATSEDMRRRMNSKHMSATYHYIRMDDKLYGRLLRDYDGTLEHRRNFDFHAFFVANCRGVVLQNVLLSIAAEDPGEPAKAKAKRVAMAPPAKSKRGALAPLAKAQDGALAPPQAKAKPVFVHKAQMPPSPPPPPQQQQQHQASPATSASSDAASDATITLPPPPQQQQQQQASPASSASSDAASDATITVTVRVAWPTSRPSAGR